MKGFVLNNDGFQKDPYNDSTPENNPENIGYLSNLNDPINLGLM